MRRAGKGSRELRIFERRQDSYTARLHTWEMRDAREKKEPKTESVKVLHKIHDRLENVESALRYSVSALAT